MKERKKSVWKTEEQEIAGSVDETAETLNWRNSGKTLVRTKASGTMPKIR